MRTWLPWLLRLIGPLLLILFLVNSDIEQLWIILRNADPWPILLSLLLMPPFLLIKSWRWQLLLHDLEIRMPLRTLLGLYTVGIFLGSVTPGQAGDLAKAWYLRDHGHPLAPGLLSVMLDRLCDLLVMAAFATLGILALGQLLPHPALQTVLVAGMGLGLTLLTVLMAVRGPRQWLLTTVLPRIVPARLQQSLQRWNSQISSLTLHPRLVLLVGTASLISAFFTFWRLWLLFIALDVHVPLSLVIGVSALIAILQILPISIAGVGVRDALLIAVLTAPPYFYSQEQALGVSALFLLITLEHIIVGFIVSFWYPLDKIARQLPAETASLEEPAR
ncbi:MAG: flippase-like domain-containing protein [Chloroflexaceae bacterium]|nr:flippase-like domain-containing protein [Chloroflexaceae bacterium]